MGEMLTTSAICFAMTLIGLSLGFVLLKVTQGEQMKKQLSLKYKVKFWLKFNTVKCKKLLILKNAQNIFN